MIEQPKYGAGEDPWRRYAGALRRHVGDANRARREAETAAAEANERSRRLVTRIKDASRLLDRIERAAVAGDWPQVAELLAARRAEILERKDANDGKHDD